MSRPRTEAIARFVHSVRGERVLFDADLAALYRVSTAALDQAVKRNRQRFPADFMFRLTPREWSVMRSQVVTASPPRPMMSQTATSSRRKLAAPAYAFIAMLSSVLRSARAVEVNIAIMRTFVELRRLMDSNREIARKIEAMEKKYDEQFALVFDAIGNEADLSRDGSVPQIFEFGLRPRI